MMSLLRTAGLTFSLEAERCLYDSKPCFSWEIALFSFVFWMVGLHIIKYGCYALLTRLSAHVDPARAYLPDEYPINHHFGKQKEWTRRVANVTEKELDEFIENRLGKNRAPKDMTLRQKQELAARETVQYKGEAYEEIFTDYLDEKHNGAKFPTRQRSWNGWRGFFAELGYHDRLKLSGGISWALQHLVCGILAYYSWQYDTSYARLFIYCDIGFNGVDLLLMGLSTVIKYDISTFSGWRPMRDSHKELFVNLMLHHSGGILLETGSLLLDYDPLLWGEMGFAMLGVTGMLHFVVSLLDGTPVKDSPVGWFVVNATTLASMLYYRGIRWVVFCYYILTRAYSLGGVTATVCFTLFLALFTLFNIQFAKYYLSRVKAVYGNMLASQAKPLKQL